MSLVFGKPYKGKAVEAQMIFEQDKERVLEEGILKGPHHHKQNYQVSLPALALDFQRIIKYLMTLTKFKLVSPNDRI